MKDKSEFEGDNFQPHKENAMYAQAAIKSNTLLRNGAYGIVMRGVQKCTCAGASLRGRNSAPLCCIKLDTATDPCYGTGGFLIASLVNLSSRGMNADDICRNNLYGYDIQPEMYTIMMANLILRGCETEHIAYANFMEMDSSVIRDKIKPTVGFMNPPYAQGKKDIKLSEICFTKHLLDSLEDGAKCVVIVPASTFTDSKKTNQYKHDIYNNHTLEGVITLNEDTFWGIGTMPIIAVFTAHKPHPKDKVCKFIDFRDDGYISQPHVGRIFTPDSDVQKEYLLKVWNDEIEAGKDFCIKTMVEWDDEWLYNFYHSNLNIPEKRLFDDKINKYSTFHHNMILNGKSHLFKDEEKAEACRDIKELTEKIWGIFRLGDEFAVSGAKVTSEKKLINGNDMPRVTASMLNNAYEGFYSASMTDGKKAKINKGNVVTIETANKGETFYQPSSFIANPHVMTISLKDRKMNQYIGLFLAVCITNAIKKKYYYGYKFSKFRILKEHVLLPLNEDNAIDYDYMERYVKNIIYNKNIISEAYRL